MDDVEPKHMTHAHLNKITDGFSEDRILGRGSFGVVYKGKDGDGKEIAVKMLHPSLVGVKDKDFIREFNYLSMLKHPNIIRLLGYCNDEMEELVKHNGKTILAYRLHRALCLEYMENRSLRSHLSDVDHGIGWRKRYRIIKGVCEGLKCLHMGKPPVLHLDLKPDNILLDKNMVPKIADFGLSRLTGQENTKCTTSFVGTCGYSPPEYINKNIISKEFDIYSLGVITINIIGGPGSYVPINEQEKAKFTEHAINKWRERLQLIPGYAPIVETECQQLNACIEIAFQCLEDDRKKRPTIGCIIDQLNETEKNKTSPASWVEKFDDREPMTPKSNMPEMDSKATGGKRSESKPCHGSTLIQEQPLDFWKKITNEFSDERKISCCAFGTVYKGVLDDGQLVAVRKLADNMPVPPREQFINRATNLMALHHNNIVKFLSFGMGIDKKMSEQDGRIIVVDNHESVLCFEYLSQRSLHDYLLDDTNMPDWCTKIEIIKGICQGLRFLHHGNMGNSIVHLYLHPDNIMFDDKMVPKIASFDISRFLDPEISRISTINVVGKRGYMAPEYLYRGEISPRCDIYSLGLLIMEIATGEKNYHSVKDMSARNFVDMIRETWTDGLIASMYSSFNAVVLQQVRACIEIGLKCVDVDQNKRPSIVEIVEWIGSAESKQNVANVGTGVSTVLLDVHPARLHLPFKPDKLVSCSLRLTNTRDDHVAVRLSTESARKYMSKMPLCCVVPPMSTYTFVVTRSQQKKQPLSGSNNEFLTLESSIVADGDTVLKNAYLDSAARDFRNFFKEAKEAAADKVVYELKLNVISDPLQEISSVQPQQPEIEIISDRKFSQVLSVDVHLTKPWILTATHGGEVVIWDFRAQAPVISFDFTQRPVYSAKFIEREEWLVAGDGYGTIYVYNYDTGEEITIIDEAHDGDITALAVHPTDPYVLSSSDDHLIKLWDWKNDWECARTFEGHMNKVTHVNFNPMDANSFATSCLDHTIKIWNISSSECKITLSGRSGLLCVHNYKSNMRQYLVAGSLDGTAQIWDMDTGRCVQTLEGHVSHISCVYRHPKLPLVITGSNDGTLRLWNSSTYRLENIVGTNLGPVYSLGYIKDLRRIVVGCHQGIAIMETKFP